MISMSISGKNVDSERPPGVNAMQPAIHSISPTDLYDRIGTASRSVVIDVRRPRLLCQKRSSNRLSFSPS
jgi:hypothetical protein